jgi:hypothetical protein
MTCKECRRLTLLKGDVTECTLAVVAAYVAHIRKCRKCHKYVSNVVERQDKARTARQRRLHREACDSMFPELLKKLRADPETAAIYRGETRK